MTNFIETAEADIVAVGKKLVGWVETEEGKVASLMSPAITQIVALAKTLPGDFDAAVQALLDAGAKAVEAGMPLILEGNVTGAEAAAATTFLTTLGIEGRAILTNAEALFVKTMVATKQLATTAISTVAADVSAVAAAATGDTPSATPAA